MSTAGKRAFDETVQIGERLRFWREEKGYTLKKVSELSGLSVGFISQVERSQTDPSIASLKRLTNALGIRLKDLFEHDAASVAVVRKGDAPKMYFSGNIVGEVLAPSIDKQMEPIFKHIPSGAESGCISAHAGEEFVWILGGQLTLSVGSDTYVLDTGDSIYFKADKDHSWIVQNSACDALWIITPPIYT